MKVMDFAKSRVQNILSGMGYALVRSKNHKEPPFPIEFSVEDRDLVRDVIASNLSMVSLEGLCSTLAACKYVCERDVEGDFVECGVWRGGNALIAAEIFRRYNSSKRVYLFDTFRGMTEPSIEDTSLADGTSALGEFQSSDRGDYNAWCFSSEEEVRNAFRSRELLSDRVVFVAGDVEKTLDDTDNLPNSISLLRLDTDWYESTRKELEVLYPLLSQGGCLIVDDYGVWSGAKKATDEYFQQATYSKPFFHVTDNTRRIAVKNG